MNYRESDILDFTAFKEHGLWQCRGFNTNGLHFNRAFRTKKEAYAFLSRMKKGYNSDRY